MHTTETVWLEEHDTTGRWVTTWVRPQCSCGWHGDEVDHNRSADADEAANNHEMRETIRQMMADFDAATH